ncbi:MAG: type I-C CRISPR-associated endonuclease Cas1c [Gordonibacter sp.]|uniref:type I-C CRISPR-associated endonuclease Cas1c n=2 Tax=Gordonibacter sp. TaxID=1968902 RepID=UPI002FC98980
MLFRIGTKGFDDMKKLLNTLYVTDPEARLVKEDDAVSVMVSDRRALHVPFHLLDSIVIFGYRGCGASLLGECAERGITISFLDGEGRFLARVEGAVSGNVLLRRAQYRLSDDKEASLAIAKRFVGAKVSNSRKVLERYRRDYPEDIDESYLAAVEALRCAQRSAVEVKTADQLRGVEGDAAHVYFSVFDRMVRVEEPSLRFAGRSRRPPRDPVNAMLSFFYSLLSRDIASACETIGLDPQIGFLHRDRPGRASLALDLMEEFRAPYVDRFVLSLVNRRQVSSGDFELREGGGVVLSDEARKRVLGLWQKKKQESITHPFLKEKMPVGLLPFIQAQLFARFLRGDMESYPAFLWR